VALGSPSGQVRPIFLVISLVAGVAVCGFYLFEYREYLRAPAQRTIPKIALLANNIAVAIAAIVRFGFHV